LLTWSAPARAFVIRAGRQREPFAWPKAGVIFDILNMKTGWCSTATGVAPQWQWALRDDAVLYDLGHFGRQPGANYKKGFSIPCAIGGDNTATWEQAGAATLDCLIRLTSRWDVQKLAAGKLPLVRLYGAQVEKYNKGSTTAPDLSVWRWVRRPACLGGDEAFDTVIANAEAEWARATAGWTARTTSGEIDEV
jgi:hypothetical protein